jgi:hypothetical protein
MSPIKAIGPEPAAHGRHAPAAVMAAIAIEVMGEAGAATANHADVDFAGQ